MSSNVGIALLLAAATLLPSLIIANHEEDFAFDISDDLEVEVDGDQLGKWNNRDFTANVGRVFHLIIPRDAFGGEVKSYQAKQQGSKGLPLWLLFDKESGVFWGVPLIDDISTIHLTVRSIGDKNITEELTINVVEDNEDATGIETCASNEDSTVLTLLLDKNLRAIKPKQRIVAMNNIAKFFGLPYSAFTLKPQIQKDDITDSSVVLAGPGNLHSRTSKMTSLLQVPVGCDGRLWLSTTPMVHQLKQQARDGTISEVLRLPLIGWRVKTETKPVLRSKRQVSSVDDYGSGDYGDEDADYYENYEDDYGEDDLDPNESEAPPPKAPAALPTVKTTPTTTSTTTTESTTHPHRHHHGEINPSAPVLREHHQTTHKISTTQENIPLPLPTTTTTTTTTTERIIEPSTITTTTTTTTTTTPSPTTTASPEEPKTVKAERGKPKSYSDYEEDYDYEAYDDEDDDAEGPIESETIMPDFAKKRTSTPVSETSESITTVSTTTTTTTVKEVIPETAPTVVPSITNATTMSTTPTTTTSTTTTVEPSTTFQIVVDTEPEIVYTTENEQHSTTFSVGITPQQTTVTSTVTATTTPTTTTTTTTTTPPIPTTITSTTTTTEAPTTQEETTFKETTVRHIITTPKMVTPIREVTESIEYHENFEPFIENRLQQMSVTAGKIFRFVIPLNTFKDFEDEYNLTYELLDSNNRTVRNNTWLHFNPTRREVYGLPLEEDVSKWVFWVKAYDREGGSVQEILNIQVQQHKMDLVVNHEFSLHIRIEKHQEFPHYVDWSLRVLRALGRIYNTNMSEITVRHINYTSEPVIFTWSNDSVPTDYCPKTDIEKLYKTLTANDRGDPSRELNIALAPELRVKRVVYRELGVCKEIQIAATPPINFSPILRNPVDKLNATVGELLVYKVKDDTFYDPEDVDPRMLNISLLTSDRKPIPPNNWLQFDNKNREFFGIPRKAGRSEYQLVCVDSGGLPATDSLEVTVFPPPKRKYNVEFSMNITEIPYDTFVNSAALQKKFVEKLMELFNDSTSDSIHLLPFKQTYDSTIVTWFNKSLTTEACPHDEINRLESILRTDKSISHKVHNVMEPDFRVSTIKVHLIDNCKPKIITHDPRPEIVVPMEETTPPSSSDDYLITFIVPAVIISIMLFLAAVAACVLYRRRRTGKMNVEEDGRQSYGNKGIPVIFQEELEEKPEPGTKAPVILKDEKPPLAPPEYSKSGSVKLTDDSEPYQPPPPFTRTQDNGRQPRPKPTPTYRKPPPYVPP